MARADIDELKIVIQADDQATTAIGNIIDQLETLGNFSIKGDMFQKLGDQAEGTNGKLEEANALLERLTEVANSGGLGDTFLTEADALRLKLALAEKEAEKLQEDLSTDKAQKRFANVSLEADRLQRKLEKIDSKALNQVATDAEQASEAISMAGETVEALGGADSMLTSSGADATAEMSEGVREVDQEIAELIDHLAELAHATRISEVLDFIDTATQAELVRGKILAIAQEIERLENAGGSQLRIQTLYEQASRLKDKLYELENPVEQLSLGISKLDAMNFANSIDKVGLLEMKLSEAYEELRKLMDNPDTPQTAIINKIATIHRLEEQITKARAEMDALQGSSSTGFFDRFTKSIPSVDALFAKLTTTMKSLGKEVGKTSAKMLLFPFAQVAKGAGKLTKAIGKVFTKLKTVALYRMLRGFIKMINEGFKEGTNNAYQWSKLMNNLPQGDLGRYAKTLDSLASSALYLKNAFASMAIPILNALEPALTKLIAKFVDAINVANRFFATLLQRKTWTKALYYPKEFAEGLDQATGSAKDLKDAITILGIDEINPLNAVKTPSGGGGGADDALDYASMFEEVVTETSDRFGDFFEPFEQAWQTKGQGVLDSMQNAMSGLSMAVGSVKESFWEVWTNGTGQTSIERILGIFTGISDTIGNIARQFSIGWDFNDNGTRLVQGVWDILNDILKMWEDITTATADWAKDLDFRPIIDAVADLAEGIESVVDPITRAISWTWENVVLVLGKWCIEKGLPKFVSALAEALEAVGSALSALGKGESKEGTITLGDIMGFLGRNALSTIEHNLQFLTDMLSVISDIANILAGKKTLKMVFFERVEEFSLRLQTRLHYLAKAWEALLNLDFDAIEDNLRNAWNPTDSPYYLNTTAIINKIDDQRKKQDQRLQFMAEITEVGGFDGALPSGGNLSIGGVTYGVGGGAVPVTLGKLNVTETPEIEVTAKMDKAVDSIPLRQKTIDSMTAQLAFKNEQFAKTTDPMVASLADKRESFVKTTGDMTATLADKNETFGKTTSDMTARLSKKVENFGTTTGDMTAKLAKKSETFGKTTSDMTASLSKKSETFSKTTGDMTAKLTKRADDIPTADRWIGNVKAYVKSLAKADGFTGLSLSGSVTASTVGSQSKVAVALKKRGGIFSNGFWRNIPQYSAGTLHAGSMFIAGEAGAELVGNVGGRTEVLNQSQIAQAMASSMMQANASQNAILQEQNSLLRQLLQKDTNVTAILSTSSLIDGANRQNKRTGRTVIPVGV